HNGSSRQTLEITCDDRRGGCRARGRGTARGSHAAAALGGAGDGGGRGRCAAAGVPDRRAVVVRPAGGGAARGGGTPARVLGRYRPGSGGRVELPRPAAVLDADRRRYRAV